MSGVSELIPVTWSWLYEGDSIIDDGVDGFTIGREIANLYNRLGDTGAREVVIECLSRKEELGSGASILTDVARECGLFPYLDTKLDSRGAFARQYHQAQIGDETVVFHRSQLTIHQRLLAGKDVVLSAPTSFGKSILIDAVISSCRPNLVVVIVPTIALIDETRRRLARRFGDQYKIVTHHSQLLSGKDICVLTQERFLDRDDIGEIDLLIIDEFYKLAPKQGAERDHRMELLNLVIHKAMPVSKQLYLLGPYIDELDDRVPARLKDAFVRFDDSMVASKLHVHPEPDDLVRTAAELAVSLDGPTTLFVSSPAKASQMASGLCDLLADNEWESSQLVQGLEDWGAEHFHPGWWPVRSLASGVGIHHGRVPRSFASAVVDFYNQGHLNYMVCTSTMIEGVNTVAKNIIIVDHQINRRGIDYFTFKNISGRAGRFMQHSVGHVHMFRDPPQRELQSVDIPILTHSESLTDSLLFQVNREDLDGANKNRREDLADGHLLSDETIRLNTGIDVQSQVSASRRIEADLGEAQKAFLWENGQPRWSQLLFLCQFIWREFCKDQGRGGVATAKQLCYLVSRLRDKPTTRELIESSLKYNSFDPDLSTDKILAFYRYWAEYAFPHFTMCLSRIVNDVFVHHDIELVNFEYFATSVQHLFRDICLTAFEEYGVPVQLGDRLEKELVAGNDLDSSLAKLREIDLDNYDLTDIELYFISRARA